MILRLIFIFLIITSCTNSTGFKNEPKGTKPKEIGLEQTGVTLDFYNLNKINTASLPKFEDIKKNKDKNFI